MTADPWLTEPAVIDAVEPETPGVATFRMRLRDSGRQAAYRFAPGQFNMLYVPGVGEVPISMSSGPSEGDGVAHTIRFVGRVTNVIAQLKPGDVLGLRGPYGRGWPMEAAHGNDLLIVAGGLGLAPLRPAVLAVAAERERFGRVWLLYGARKPRELLYSNDYDRWRGCGIELLTTVDHADESWRGSVGVVPRLVDRIDFDPSRTVAFTCGPEIMMRFTILELLHRGLPAERTFLSIELNMQCALGMCGRCQLGPYFVCKDGPVFAYNRVARFFNTEHF